MKKTLGSLVSAQEATVRRSSRQERGRWWLASHLTAVQSRDLQDEGIQILQAVVVQELVQLLFCSSRIESLFDGESICLQLRHQG